MHSPHPHLLALALLCAASALPAQEPAAPLATRPLPEAAVLRSATLRVMAEEPSGFPELPPVRKEITATVEFIEDPGLPQPPPPLPALDRSDPAVQARLRALQARWQQDPLEFAYVSATWYPQEKVSEVRWWVEGEEMVALSRIDFHHFSGVGGFEGEGRRYALVLGLGTVDTEQLELLHQRQGWTAYEAPEFPAIPEGEEFVMRRGAASEGAKRELLEALHGFYREQGVALAAAYEEREQARARLREERRLHPPQPQDVTIRFWQRQEAAHQGEGGAK